MTGLYGTTGGDWSVDPLNGDIVSGPYNVAILYACKPNDKRAIAQVPAMLALVAALGGYG